MDASDHKGGREPDISQGEIYYYLRSRNPKDHDLMQERALALRKEHRLDRIKAIGLVTISSHCYRDCIYCGCSNDVPDIPRFRLKLDEVLGACEAASHSGIKTMVLKSGDDPSYNNEALFEITKNVKNNFDFDLVLSFGERKGEVYEMWRSSGAKGYWLRFDTCDPHIYRRVRPSMFSVDRMRSLKAAAKAGFSLGTGVLIGMPNQGFESLVEDILFMTDPGIFGIEIEPFMPPLGSRGYQLVQKPENLIVAPDIMTMEKVVAITRLLRPDAVIPITNAHIFKFNALGGDGFWKSGANSIILDFTPLDYQREGAQALFTGCPVEAEERLYEVQEKLESFGLRLVFDDPVVPPSAD